jgi:Tol biopolymer transport system component
VPLPGDEYASRVNKAYRIVREVGMRKVAFLVALAIAGLLLACTGDEGASKPTPAVTATASAAPAPLRTATPTPAVTQAPSPAQPVALEERASVAEAGLYLVETATGKLWHVEGSAAWAPDGKSLARWICCPEQGGGLDVIEVPDGPAMRILDRGIDTVAWSPDGTQIAFSQWGEGPEGVYVINSDGSGLKELSPKGTHFVQWSRTGDRLAFYRDEHVYVLRLASGEVTDVAQQAHDFAWSPDDATLAFTDDSGLYIYDPDTGERRQVATGMSGGPILWSPGGSRIAYPFGPLVPLVYGPYANDPEVGVQVLHVVEVQSSEEPKPLSPARYPAWSPDGTKIAYLSEGCITGDWDIYSVGPDGSSAVGLTSSPKTVKEGPYWSPTGAAIAFSTFGELILLDVESGEMQTLVESGWPETTGRDIHLHGSPWSPDGRYIQFTVGTAHGICD